MDSFVFLDFFFGVLFFLAFWFLHSKTKKKQKRKNQKKNPKNQNSPRILRESLVFVFLVLARVWFWTDEIRAETRYLRKSTKSPVGAVSKGMVCHGGGGVTIYIYIYT